VIVVDASALIEVLLRTSVGLAAEKRLTSPHDMAQAPHLIDIEITHVLRRAAALRQITAERGREALDDLADFPLLRHQHDDLLPRIWGLRNNLTAYDAAYVALAEFLDAPLLTRDARLANSSGHRARIELL
jgi:predicted nucleic acid-binding protein